MDSLVGQFIKTLKDNGVIDQVIIAITGDHGLRFSYEFELLGHQFFHSDLTFNVPLLIYSPGLFDKSIPLPYLTSHVDIAPTLLFLVGVPTEGLIHHGMNVLD